MNLSEYNKLCAICDEILLSEKSTIYTRAIPWLHVLNEHPTTLKRYENIKIKNKNKFISYLKCFIQFFLNLLRGSSKNPWVASSDVNQKDVLIVSHLLNKSQLGSKEDFYFGDLPSGLMAKGKSSLILLLNHPAIDIDKIHGKWHVDECPRILFANKLSLLNELKLCLKVIKESFLIRARSKKLTDPYKKDIYDAASQAVISFESISSIRFIYQMIDLIKATKPKVIITTLEGHCWERLVFHCARSIFPEIKCIGYQHAILFPRQHAVKLPLFNDLDPDVIFTAGLHSKDILSAGYGASHKVKIKCAGTHRREDFFVSEAIANNKRKIPCCLILPDGNLIECLRLCEFANNLAHALPQFQFIIRLHPLVELNYLKRKSKMFINLSKNISFSGNKNINDDFLLASWALYRGSGSAIHAAIAGLRPIYFSNKKELSIDPLFQINSGRKIIYNHSDLENILNDDLSKSSEAINFELEELKIFSRDYYKAVDMNTIMNEISIKN